VITMEMIGQIRRMHFRDGLSLHQIAKRTGISRNTIRQWVRAPKLDNPPGYQRRVTPGKLTPHSEFLQTALKADSLRPKKHRRSARALFAQSQEQGYSGGYSRVTDFVRDWHAGEGRRIKAFVPLQCRRSAKIEQRFTLNFDQGWRAGGDPPAVDKCIAVAGADNGVVGVKAVSG